MSKKGTSVTFETTTIEVVNKICEETPTNPSFSSMSEHLISTNPAFIKMKEKMDREKNPKVKKQKA